MTNLSNDLEKFLRSDGLRILMDSEGVRTEPYEPLTEDDIDDLASMNLDNLDRDHLEDLLDKAEDLQDETEDDEPEDEDNEEHEIWEDRISEIEDFIDRIQDRLDELKVKESEDAGTVAERIVWKNKT